MITYFKDKKLESVNAHSKGAPSFNHGNETSVITCPLSVNGLVDITSRHVPL